MAVAPRGTLESYPAHAPDARETLCPEPQPPRPRWVMPFPFRVCVLLAATSCTSLTEPPTETEHPAPAAADAPAPTAGTRDIAVQRILVPPAASAPKEPARINASHILVSFRGAVGSHAERTEDAARQLASQILAKIRGGGDFTKLANQYTDDAKGKGKGGSLGEIDRAVAPPEFTAAAFALAPGQVSDVVKTPFGFHIIRRDQ